MSKIAIAIHAGAENENSFVEENPQIHKQGLEAAVKRGYEVLRRGGSALKAVEEAVICLEDNPLFNAGRGSALNARGEVEMDAAIMCGKTAKAGAVSMARNVKNPITLARMVMNDSKHVFLSGYGALHFANMEDLVLEPESYFITEQQFKAFLESRDSQDLQQFLRKKYHGTVGAVALDKEGNLASATSTGGTPNCLPGRIGDSCVIGAGCYAHNPTCAVSATGEGEFLITGVVASAVSFIKELLNKNLQEACDEVIHKRNPKTFEMGLISVSQEGHIGISFNTKLMKRAWIDVDGHLHVKIKKED
ncbi:isoaspartyl peptidase/L-asparaginase family protein [Legionella jordanis]|uniref:Isoaspartyl peptidase n=1 Tax=Legionella jordanis TaxID=456 RepID=A0A0W0VCT5_9GAMM|nr:isoaspartyl peptidase/L-asparaginase [Legionella jordanis]KTD17693.1 isoaspartyl dipeptidase with L-asparaginase activity [Legionella jordanis]RMX01564.1 isoaspartyl peptidase/L-asparaginase [Legionella jordanis]RMX21560.1 isoaspartyl peptidase/L-asparaginase [Legionella jordanis]VEH11375.1 isoaspartyl dipeptidase with L-asparaginase activity [Legionella jordanis]